MNRFEEAKKFYSWLMLQIGYSRSFEYPQGGKRGIGFYNDAGSFWVQEAEAPFHRDSFHRHRVGLCEIAFLAESRAQIDSLASEIASHGGTVTDPPREYDYAPGYYSVFFTDPDGLKLELVHLPS
ncbi:MAG TPA: VOC family protein [Candidatus Binataceae bacterium]|nr:VOC family protein [Candidatus Binataceae bacterium]